MYRNCGAPCKSFYADVVSIGEDMEGVRLAFFCFFP